MDVFMYNNFSLVALYEYESKRPFIETMWYNGYIPCIYSKNKKVTSFMDKHSDIRRKCIGVMFLIEYEENEFQC